MEVVNLQFSQGNPPGLDIGHFFLQIENKVDIRFTGEGKLLFENPVFSDISLLVVTGRSRAGNKQGNKKQYEL